MSDDAFFRTYLPYLLAQAAHRLSLAFHRQLKARGIREVEWRVLAILSGSPGKSVNEIADEVLVPQSTLSRRLAKMERAGLVRRRSHSNDRRMSVITLSEAGQRLAGDLIKQAADAEARDTSALGPDKLRDLRVLLEHLVGRRGGQ